MPLAKKRHAGNEQKAHLQSKTCFYLLDRVSFLVRHPKATEKTSQVSAAAIPIWFLSISALQHSRASRFPAPASLKACAFCSPRFFAARVFCSLRFFAAAALPANLSKKFFKKILTYALKNSKINSQVTLTIMLRCYAHFCRAICIFSMRSCTTRKGTE